MAFDKTNGDSGVDNPVAGGATGSGRMSRFGRPLRYLSTVFGMAVVGLAVTFVANRCFAPEMYLPRTARVIGKALAKGENYAVFDLNINIRAIRSSQIARLKAAPDVALVGASQWQEAHGDLMPNARFLNVHVHRDYYEDILAMSEVLVRNDKLPRTMVIAIRDALFSPIEERRDHLWLPAIDDYRAMAARLNIEPHSAWATSSNARLREQISMPMLFNNVTRWYNASAWPGTTEHRNSSSSLDTLLPDGSISWSRQHKAQFTAERSQRLALASAAFESTRPHGIDPNGVGAVDALFGYLTAKGVDVVIVFPPFNPVFFDKVRDTPFMVGLHRLEAISRGLAEKHGLRLIGSFNPADVGCTADMFIDAEHSNPLCLSRVIKQLAPATIAPKPLLVSEAEAPIPTNDLARQQLLILQNARAQASLAGAPERDRIDVIVAAAAPATGKVPAQVQSVLAPADATTPPAESIAATPRAPTAIAAPKASRQRPRVAAKLQADSDDQPATKSQPNVGQDATRAPGRQLWRHEFVWPGDQAPANSRRRIEHSSADR